MCRGNQLPLQPFAPRQHTSPLTTCRNGGGTLRVLTVLMGLLPALMWGAQRGGQGPPPPTEDSSGSRGTRLGHPNQGRPLNEAPTNEAGPLPTTADEGAGDGAGRTPRPQATTQRSRTPSGGRGKTTAEAPAGTAAASRHVEPSRHTAPNTRGKPAAAAEASSQQPVDRNTTTAARRGTATPGSTTTPGTQATPTTHPHSRHKDPTTTHATTTTSTSRHNHRTRYAPSWQPDTDPWHENGSLAPEETVPHYPGQQSRPTVPKLHLPQQQARPTSSSTAPPANPQPPANAGPAHDTTKPPQHQQRSTGDSQTQADQQQATNTHNTGGHSRAAASSRDTDPGTSQSRTPPAETKAKPPQPPQTPTSSSTPTSPQAAADNTGTRGGGNPPGLTVREAYLFATTGQLPDDLDEREDDEEQAEEENQADGGRRRAQPPQTASTRAGENNAPATSGKKQHSKRGCADTDTHGVGKTMSQDAAANRRGREDRATTNHSGRSRQQQQPEEEPHPSSEPGTTQRQRPLWWADLLNRHLLPWPAPTPATDTSDDTAARGTQEKSPKQRGRNPTRPQRTRTHHNRAGTTQRLGHATAAAQPRTRKTAPRNTNTTTAPPGHTASRHNQKKQQRGSGHNGLREGCRPNRNLGVPPASGAAAAGRRPGLPRSRCPHEQAGCHLCAPPPLPEALPKDMAYLLSARPRAREPVQLDDLSLACAKCSRSGPTPRESRKSPMQNASETQKPIP